MASFRISLLLTYYNSRVLPDMGFIQRIMECLTISCGVKILPYTCAYLFVTSIL